MKQFIYLHAAEVTGMAALVTLLLVVFFFSQFWYRRHKKPNLFQSLVEIILTSISALLAVLFVAIFIEAVFREPCNSEIAHKFHYFNAHLKSLCLERDDKSECPRNEEALRAFNPPAYQELNSCTTTKYIFDESTQEYKWLVRFGKPSDTILLSPPDPHTIITLNEAMSKGWW